MRRPHKAPRYERERRSTPHGGEAGTLRGLHYLQRYFGPQHDVIRAAYLLARDARLQHMFGMEREERCNDRDIRFVQAGRYKDIIQAQAEQGRVERPLRLVTLELTRIRRHRRFGLVIPFRRCAAVTKEFSMGRQLVIR